MVGFSPATREVRVRFPANAAQLNLGLRFPPLDCQKSEEGDQSAAGRSGGGFGKPAEEEAQNPRPFPASAFQLCPLRLHDFQDGPTLSRWQSFC